VSFPEGTTTVETTSYVLMWLDPKPERLDLARPDQRRSARMTAATPLFGGAQRPQGRGWPVCSDPTSAAGVGGLVPESMIFCSCSGVGSYRHMMVCRAPGL
jgi:hypothetical protein